VSASFPLPVVDLLAQTWRKPLSKIQEDDLKKSSDVKNHHHYLWISHGQLAINNGQSTDNDDDSNH